MSFNSNLKEFLRPSEVNDILPDGTAIFVGINLIREDGKWVQKSAFAKVQNMGKAYKPSTKNKINNESKIADVLGEDYVLKENSDF